MYTVKMTMEKKKKKTTGETQHEVGSRCQRLIGTRETRSRTAIFLNYLAGSRWPSENRRGEGG